MRQIAEIKLELSKCWQCPNCYAWMVQNQARCIWCDGPRPKEPFFAKKITPSTPPRPTPKHKKLGYALLAAVLFLPACVPVVPPSSTQNFPGRRLPPLHPQAVPAPNPMHLPKR